MSMNTPNAKKGKNLKIKNRNSKELIPYISMKKEHTHIIYLSHSLVFLLGRRARMSPVGIKCISVM